MFALGAGAARSKTVLTTLTFNAIQLGNQAAKTTKSPISG
jgi:hypothetical protein